MSTVDEIPKRHGRSYPEHLKDMHAYDEQVLPVLTRLAPATFDQLVLQVEDSRIRADLPRWLSSAEWRGLIVSDDMHSRLPRIYTLARSDQ